MAQCVYSLNCWDTFMQSFFEYDGGMYIVY